MGHFILDTLKYNTITISNIRFNYPVGKNLAFIFLYEH